MGKSAPLLFAELSNPEFVETCLATLEEGEKDNKDAVIATLIVHVNAHANSRSDEGNGLYNDVSYTDIANVANSLYVGIKTGYSIAPR